MLIATAAFDVVAYLRGRAAPGTMAAMDARPLAFVLAIVLMVFVPVMFGAPMTKLF